RFPLQGGSPGRAAEAPAGTGFGSHAQRRLLLRDREAMGRERRRGDSAREDPGDVCRGWLAFWPRRSWAERVLWPGAPAETHRQPGARVSRDSLDLRRADPLSAAPGAQPGTRRPQTVTLEGGEGER